MFTLSPWPLVSPGWDPHDRLSIPLPGMLGGKEKALAGKVPDSSSEWLKQFDAVLPGYSLKGELDLLTLLRQVSGVLGAWEGGIGVPMGLWLCGGTGVGAFWWRCMVVPVGHPVVAGTFLGGRVSPWDGAESPRKESRRSLQGWGHMGC